MKKATRILIVENIRADAKLAEGEIRKVVRDVTTHIVETRKEFLKALETFQPDVILANYALPRLDGIAALKLARKQAPFTPLIIWTGSSSEDMAVNCLKAGANNYVLKENVKRLGPAVLRALGERKLLLARQQAEEKYQTIFENSVVGIFQSTPEGRYRKVNAAMARIYGYDSPLGMIEGVKDIKQQIYVDANRRAEFIRLLHTQNSVEHYEARNYRKDGSIIWTSTSARTVCDPSGNIIYYEGFITDITARKEIEEKLQERERQLMILFSNLPGPVYRCQNDAAHTMDFISEGIKELSGYPAEDFLKHRRDFGKLIHPQDQERVWAEIQIAVNQNQPFALTYRIITAAGQQKWVWEKGQGVYDTKGQLQALEGFITDITERKQAEEATQISEKRFRALIENGLDNISLLAADGTLLWESPATIRTLNYVPDEYVGRNIFELMHPDDLTWTRDLYMKLLQEPGGRQTGVFRLRHFNGSWRWVEAIVTNMLNEPSVNAIVVNYRDVTERKQAEEAVHESQGKYQNLVETSHDLIWSIDAEARFTFINRAVKEVYGYEPEELPGRSCLDFLDPEYYGKEELEKFKETLARANEMREVETYVRHRDGRQIILSTNAIVARDANGQTVEVTGSSRDITIRKRVADVLNEERNLLRTLIDNLPDRIYAMDMEGRKTLSNTADWQACGGKNMEDILGKTDFDIYPVDLANEFWQLNRVVLESGQAVINYEEPGLDAEGNRVSILTTKIPLRDDEGKITGLVGIGRDITDRKQAEARINDLLAFNEKILNHSAIGILTYKASGVCVFANEKISSIFGTTVAQLMAQNFRNIESWKRSGLYDLVEKAMTTQSPTTADIHHVSTVGKEVWMTVQCLTFQAKGEDHVLLSISDITERRLAEEKLRQSENRYRLALKATNDVIWESNLQTKQLFWSENAQIVFGYSPQEIASYETWWEDHLHPEDRERVLSKLNALIDGEESIWMEEYRFQIKDGSYAHISDRGYVERNANGTPLRMIGAMTNITERKQAEDKLRESENRLFMALSGAQMSVWEWDLKTNQIFWSPEFFKITGVNEDQFSGTFESFTDLIHNDDADRVRGAAEKAMREKTLFAEEFRIICPDGEVRWLSNLGQAEYDSSGSHLRLIGTVQDITQRKQAEIERRALLEIMQGLAHTEDLRELLKLIHESIAQVIYAKNFFVMLYEPHTGLFEEIYAVDEYDQTTPPAKLENSITSYVFRSGEPLLLTQVLFDELVKQGEVKLIGTDSASWLGVPLKTSGRNIGVMAVQDYEYDNRYTERDKHFLASIAAQVGLVIERKKAEEALRESEEHYRAIFEGVQDAILVESLDGKILMVNQRACEMFGYSQTEFLTKTVADLVPEGHLILRAEGGSSLLTTEPRETINRRANGETFPIDISGRLQVINGETMLLVVVRDITERKRMEAAEREQRTLAEALRDTAETLSSTLDYGEVLDHILEAVGRVVPHDAATIMLIDGEHAHVVRSHGYNESNFNTEIMGLRLPVAHTTNLRQMLETRQPVVISDTHTYPNWKRMPATNWLRSNVGAPISLYGEMIGFICLDGRAPEFFTPAHAERLEAFANQAALAIHNARLLQKAQEEIRERKRVEEALRFEKERLEKIAAAVPGVISSLRLRGDGSGCMPFASPAIQDVYGFLPEELEQDLAPFFARIHPEDLSHVKTSIQESGQTMLPWHDVFRYNHPIKGDVWIEGQSMPLREEDGSIIWHGFAYDITERRWAEEELRASEERFRQLADNIQEVFWMTDAESGEEIYMSPAAEAIWAQPIDRLMQEPNAFLNTVFPEDRPLVLQNVEKEKMGEKAEMEYRILRPDGTVRWVWDRAFPIFDGSEKVKMIAGITADITERKQAEKSLRESEERYHGLFQNLVDGFALHEIVTDDDGTPVDYTFLEVNPAFEKSTGLAVTQLIGQRVTDVLPGVENERFISIYGQVALTGNPVHFEEYSLPLGKYFEINAYSPKHGQFAVTFVDVTERKKAENEIRRRAEENSILLKTSLALTNLDLNTTLQTVGDSAKNLFAADGCRIFLMEPDGRTLRCVLALQESLDAFSDLRIKLGEGVTGAVAASGKAEIVNEMQNDPRSVQVTGTPEEEEAIMFAPLKERDNTLGVLSIRRTGGDRPFSPADLELLEALASMAASAVSNARLFAETQRRLAELEALYENGLAVGRLLKPSEIGNRIINTFARYLPWHHVTIRLRQEASDDLELVAFSQPSLKEEERANVEKYFIARINKVGQGLSGWVIQTGMALRTGNVHAHPQYIDTHAGIQSGIYMPLKVGERVIGVISVESEVPDAFTEQDERLLATLGSQASIAFENARLYQTIEQELSERKRAQEALLASETHYRELADSITDILFELDRELRYTHWNKASEKLAGVSAKDAIGKSMYEIFGESEEQNRLRKIFESVLENHEPKTFETILPLNGEKRSFDVNAYPSTRGVSVVAKDVTDRKRSEVIMQKRFELMEYSAHHALEELMQRTVDEVSELTGSTIGFFHFIQEDQKTLGMQTWSTNARKLFNVPVSEGTHLALDQAGVWADAVHQRRPLIQNDHETLIHKQGFPPGYLPITREIVIPIIRNERVMAIMGIGNKRQEYTSYDLEVAERLADYAWDITERKQMQVALEAERNQLARRVEERTSDLSRANSNLARALRVKDEFLANMSHELRTPLNAILGLSESLGEQIAGPLNEKQQKYITTISESGHHLLSLINDILDLAKIEAGQITLDINKVDIQQVCQASLRMIKQLAQKKNQDVVLEIGQEVGLMWADERRLKQMIVNLLGNAVKFTPERGKMGLEVHGDQMANRVTITVWDNGIGIKENDLARLFQPFVQLDTGLAREATGTGLGLALVAQMARLHGGSVSALSEPGKGSRFSIILPWEPALAVETASRLRTTGKFRAIKPDETNKPTILLVEDTKEVVMMLRDYLELAGYKIVTAQDGIEAISQARLVHPDLILMDIMMPRLDGFEATRKLRSEPEFKYTPIVALTALAMPSDRERCLAAGMDEYISKPINLKALVRIIQSCLFGSEGSKTK